MNHPTPHVDTPASKQAVSNQVVNVPNALSMARLILAIGVGVLIEVHWFVAALVVFVIAASTDFIDGWWARTFNQVTKLGRMLDPFVDKIIIAAAMIALVGIPGSRVPAWMVTIIIGRELLVTSLRAMIEGRGGDFSALWLGKVKMGVQCAAIISSLLLLASGDAWYEVWFAWTTLLLLWAALITTIGSGWEYVVRAIELGSQKES